MVTNSFLSLLESVLFRSCIVQMSARIFAKNGFLCLFSQSWPLASERHHSRAPPPTLSPDPPSRYCLPVQKIFWKMITTESLHKSPHRICQTCIETHSQFLPIKRLTSCFDHTEFHRVFIASLLWQLPIKDWKASEPRQWKSKCEKRRKSREEHCLSNMEQPASHICPFRVCEGESRRGRCCGLCFLSPNHGHWNLSGKRFLITPICLHWLLSSSTKTYADTRPSSVILKDWSPRIQRCNSLLHCNRLKVVRIFIWWQNRQMEQNNPFWSQGWPLRWGRTAELS